MAFRADPDAALRGLPARTRPHWVVGMLVDIDTGNVSARVPYAPQFDTLRARLSEVEFGAMVARINDLIDESGAQIATAGGLRNPGTRD